MKASSGPRRVALVDSPFQLLSLFEAIDAGHVEPPDTLVTRGADLAALLHLGAGLLETSRVTGDPGTGALVRLVIGAAEVIAGDPYSTLVHTAVAIPRRRRVTFVDDGAATLRALDTFAGSGEPLVRAHAVRPHQRSTGRIGGSQLARLGRRGRVTVCTGLPVSGAQLDGLRSRGFVVATHDFGWSRRVELGKQPELGNSIRQVVLGSSLAHDGLLDRNFYERWLADALVGSETVFVPHRRDLPDAVLLAAEHGAIVHIPPAGLPVELVVRDLRDGVVVHSLPSTAALTIPSIRAGRSTEMRSTLPPEGAVTSRFTPSMRALQRRIHELVLVGHDPTA